MKYCFLLPAVFSFLISCVNHDIHLEFDCEKSDLALTLIDVDSATACGIADGNIFATVTGGKPPYSFFLNEVVEYPDREFRNIKPGTYSVLVRDANKCTDTLTNIEVKAKGITYEATIGNDTECLTDNGSISIAISEGKPPYTFKIGSGEYSPENSFTNLSPGSHLISAKDNEGCVIQLNLTVSRGQTGVSWAFEIQPLLEVKCALDDCHNGQDRINDFRDYDDAKFYAKKIKSYTQDGFMPSEGSLSQEQIDLIACWVDDGAVKN